MLDIKMIRENPDLVKEGLAKRNLEVDFTELLSWDEERRTLLGKMEGMKAERNVTSKQIPIRKKNGEDVSAEIASMKELGDEITKL